MDSSFVLLLAMLQEHGYLANERNKTLYREEEGDNGEWIEVMDFDTGRKKKIRKVESV